MNRTDGSAIRPYHLWDWVRKVLGFSGDRIFLFLTFLFGMILFVAEGLPIAALPIIFRCAF
jgi:hypothetical protein